MWSDRVLMAGVAAAIALSGAFLAILGATCAIAILPKVGVGISASGVILWTVSYIMMIRDKPKKEEK